MPMLMGTAAMSAVPMKTTQNCGVCNTGVAAATAAFAAASPVGKVVSCVNIVRSTTGISTSKQALCFLSFTALYYVLHLISHAHENRS